jgi:hypothetical protein
MTVDAPNVRPQAEQARWERYRMRMTPLKVRATARLGRDFAPPNPGFGANKNAGEIVL